MFWSFVATVIASWFYINYESWIAYASATVTAYAAGLALLKLDGYRLNHLPRVVRVVLSILGVGSLWLIGGHIYQTYLNSNPQEAFEDFVTLFAIPYSQGLFVGFLFWAGVRLTRSAPSG